MDKIISCDYVMNEELIREYVNATVKTHSAPNIALIAVCTISSAVFAAQHNLSAAGLWIMAAAFLTIGEIFSSRKMIVRRTCSRLIRQHGTVNVRMRFSFENKIVCHIGRQEYKYLYGAITKITESENLMMIFFPKDMLQISKNDLKNGSIEELREFIKNKIAANKNYGNKGKQIL